jgi:3-carboxy-cis,cis-muconate cycloisomerase
VSEPAAPGLFDGVLARGPVAGAVGSAAWLQALLEAEAALAVAGAAVGLVPAEAARRIGEVCRTTAFDVASLSRDAAAAGNPVVPLVKALEAAVGAPAGRHVHRAATSQDVLDTAMVLLARRALDLLEADVVVAAAAAAALADTHRDTVMAGRTLLQQAVPTTFGLKAAGWCLALDGAAAQLRSVRAGLPVQLGGAVGTLSAGGPDSLALVEAYASELHLTVPVLAWHTSRLPVSDLAGALGGAAGVLGKVALDVVLLAQTEVAEVAEGTPGRGASSTMPHKNNPVAALSARAAARRAPGLVATLLMCMEQEHERAAGAWYAEWEAVSTLLSTVGSAAAWLADSLGSLEVDRERMASNVATYGAAMAAEAVAEALTRALGRTGAHDMVSRAVREPRGMRTALLEQREVTDVLSTADLDALLDPAQHVGQARALVDRALAQRGPAPTAPGGQP